MTVAGNPTRVQARGSTLIPFVLAWTIGLFWALSGIGKLVSLLDNLAAGLEWRRVTYVDEFPKWAVMGVVAAEIVCAVLLFAGRVRRGAVIGAVLLVILVGVLIANPPRAGVPCGCSGVLQSMLLSTGVDPIARNVLMLGLHALVIAIFAEPGVARLRRASAPPRT